MVFFTCDGCGETLKKSQVDGHANRCRRCDSVSCVDCSISFYGDDYRSHTTCSMTEVDNLVAARGTNGKKKKQSPQEAWMELLHTSVTTAPASIQRHLEQMVQLDNVPRKEKQFRNFAINSLNLRGNSAQKILDAIWNHLNQQREKQKQEREQQQQADAAAQAKKKEQQQQISQRDSNSNSDNPSNTPTASSEGANKETPSNSVSDTENASDASSTNLNKKQSEPDNDKALFKSVKKASKKLLKKSPNRSMKFKSLQKALREQIGTSDKKKLKRVMKLVVEKETKKFVLEGKQIKLL